jgi:hypothetical protein
MVRYWQLMPVILPTQEAEIGKFAIEASSRKKFWKPHLNRKKAVLGGTYL